MSLSTENGRQIMRQLMTGTTLDNDSLITKRIENELLYELFTKILI